MKNPQLRSTIDREEKKDKKISGFPGGWLGKKERKKQKHLAM